MRGRASVRSRQRVKVKKVRELKPDPKLAISTLITAKTDLRGSTRDYQDGDYPNSVYRLQQSVEKGCKSFGYQTGIIEERSVGRDISHYTTRIFVNIMSHIQGHYNRMEKEFKHLGKIFPELKDQKHYKVVLKYFSDMEKKNKEFQETLEDMSIHPDVYRNMSLDEISGLLSRYESVDKEIEIEEPKLEEYLTKLIDGLEKPRELPEKQEMMGVDLDDKKLAEANETLKRMTEGIDPTFYLKILACFREIIPLLVLSIIVQPHFMSTRYPTNNVPPEQFYVADHPVVKLSPEMHRICGKALDELDQIYNELDEDERSQVQ